jgi:hypothetical protein
MVLLSQIDKVLDEIDWFMAKIKADKAKTALESQEGCETSRHRYSVNP